MTKKTQEQNIPFQIQLLIDGMNDKNNGDHIRSNYRVTLENIRTYLDLHCAAFDSEMGAYNTKAKQR